MTSLHHDHLTAPASSPAATMLLLHARRAAPAPRRYWIIDSAPGAGPPAGGARRMLGVLRRWPGPFGSRAEAVAAVEAEGYSPVVARWMATNIAWDRGWGGGVGVADTGSTPRTRTPSSSCWRTACPPPPKPLTHASARAPAHPVSGRSGTRS